MILKGSTEYRSEESSCALLLVNPDALKRDRTQAIECLVKYKRVKRIMLCDYGSYSILNNFLKYICHSHRCFGEMADIAFGLSLFHSVRPP